LPGDIPEEKKYVELSSKLLAPFCLLNRHEFTQIRGLDIYIKYVEVCAYS